MNVLISDPAQVEAIQTDGDRTLIVLDSTLKICEIGRHEAELERVV